MGQPPPGLGTGLVRCDPGTPFLVSGSPRETGLFISGCVGSPESEKGNWLLPEGNNASLVQPKVDLLHPRIAQTKKEIGLSLSPKSKHQSPWRVWINKLDSFYYLFVSVSYYRKKKRAFIGFHILSHYGISWWHVITEPSFYSRLSPNEGGVHK